MDKRNEHKGSGAFGGRGGGAGRNGERDRGGKPAAPGNRDRRPVGGRAAAPGGQPDNRGRDERAHGREQEREHEAGAEQEQYIAGKHSILEALRAGRTINKIWVAEGAQKHHVHDILTEAKAAGIIVQTADKRKLDQLVSDVPHQGVIAQAAAYAYVEVEDILAIAERRGEPPFLLILDEIEDPHNLGSILRTADCTGVHGVIIPKRRSAQLTATVSKTSAGAVEYVAVARVTNLVQTIEKLKERGVWIGGADGAAKQEAYRADLTIPLALVIGNEGSGIGRLVKESCDFLVKLPMFGRINSLNASVAASVLMYEAVRQRMGASQPAR
ncbi:MAG: 23S rRNA (guanosine(2251)-2'-O)-methyltransferase RlmB [Paenibacillaceae bacterium]|nr:23S rRNA (guanosine(2251)-2'-O)-methyltransferase RlmB [Paenibacillaceae bacterium]